MAQPKRIMLTGGPCAGKTTVLDAVRQTYGNQILLMPEVSTIVMTNGYPVPGLDVAYSDEWLRSFQNVVLPFQLNMENQYLSMAAEKNVGMVLFDRGLLDGAAYMPGGEVEFLATFQLNKAEAFARYDLILHLESVANFDATLWDSLKSSNPTRYETLAIAVERDKNLQTIWKGHPNWHLISGQPGIDHVVHTALTHLKHIHES